MGAGVPGFDLLGYGLDVGRSGSSALTRPGVINPGLAAPACWGGVTAPSTVSHII